jgi:hypothetical protein
MLALKRTEEKEKAKAGEKRKEEAEAKEKAVAQQKLVENVREHVEEKGGGRKVRVNTDQDS